MGLDHNDRRAQNFTSGAILDRNLKKVIIPSGKNAELLQYMYAIVEAGVKDIYGDPTQKKYQKIVNLIIERFGNKLKDSNISSDLNDLSSELKKSIPELKKQIEANEKNSTKKSDSSEKQLSKLLDNINDKIIEFRKKQQEEFNELKTQIRDFAAAESNKKDKAKEQATNNKKVEAKKPVEDTKKTDVAEKRILNNISNVISELKNNVELGIKSLTSSFGDIRLSMTNSFAAFGSNFSQIQVQLNSQIQSNTQGFKDVNSQINAINENVQTALETTANTIDSVSIGTQFDALKGIITQNFERQAQIADTVKHSTLNAIKVSTKTQIKANETTKNSFMTGVSTFMGRMRNALTRRIQNLRTLTNRWGKKNQQSVESLHTTLPQKIWNGVKTAVNVLLMPIKQIASLTASLVKQIFKPFMWLIDLIKGPALLVLLAAAIIYVWPYISEYVTKLWTEYIKPAIDWLWEKIKEAWNIVYPVITQWWNDTFAPYGGFGGYLEKVIWPKLVNFWDKVVWPFIKGPGWEFVKKHWKGILITLGIWSFLKNPLGMIGLLFKTPLMLLKFIKYTVVAIKFLASGINKITGGFLGKICSALPALMVPMVVIGVAAAIADWWNSKEEEKFQERLDEIEKQNEELDKEAERRQSDLNKIATNNSTKLANSLTILKAIDANTFSLMKKAQIETEAERIIDIKLPDGSIHSVNSKAIDTWLDTQAKLVLQDGLESDLTSFAGQMAIVHDTRNRRRFFGYTQAQINELYRLKSKWDESEAERTKEASLLNPKNNYKIMGGGWAADWQTSLANVLNADAEARAIMLEVKYLIQKVATTGVNYVKVATKNKSFNEIPIIQQGLATFLREIEKLNKSFVSRLQKALQSGWSSAGRTMQLSVDTTELQNERQKIAEELSTSLYNLYLAGNTLGEKGAKDLKLDAELATHLRHYIKDEKGNDVLDEKGNKKISDYGYVSPQAIIDLNQYRVTTDYFAKLSHGGDFTSWDLFQKKGGAKLTTGIWMDALGNWLQQNTNTGQAVVANWEKSVMTGVDPMIVVAEPVARLNKEVDAQANKMIESLRAHNYNPAEGDSEQNIDFKLQERYRDYWKQAFSLLPNSQATVEEQIRLKAVWLEKMEEELDEEKNPFQRKRRELFIKALVEDYKKQIKELQENNDAETLRRLDQATIDRAWDALAPAEKTMQYGNDKAKFAQETLEQRNQHILYVLEHYGKDHDSSTALSGAAKSH